LRERTLDLTARRRAAGEGTELDVSAAELDVSEIRRDRLRAETEIDSARRALDELLGLPPACALHLTASGQPLVVIVFEDVPDAELERRLLGGRFEFRALEAAYERAEHELRLAVQSQFPNLKVGLSATHDGDGSEYLGPGVDLEIPLFNRNQGEIAAKANARDLARASFVATLHSLRAGAYEARAQLQRARVEVEMQERDVLPLVQRNQDLVERAFVAREVSILERVTAQQRALRSREAYLDSVIRYQRAVIEVEIATGMSLARPSGPDVPQKQ
jgi:cobalt-zinc-cadmium efflux system outer membrane protein